MSHPFVLLSLAAACWGTGTVISKQALDEFEPVSLLVVQLGVSVIALAAFHQWRRWRAVPEPNPSRTVTRRAAALGVLNPGLAYALGLAGLSLIAASTSVVLWASEPALIALLAVVFLRERLTSTLVIALAIALVGMTLVVYSGDLSGSPLGVALTLGAVLACAVYTVLARILVIETSAVRVTMLQQVAALGFAALLAAVVVAVSGSSVGAITSVSLTGWMTAIGSGVLYYGLAFALYLTALQQVPASVAGLFLTLVPVFGVAAALVTGETLNTQQWVGSALVVGSIAIVARSSRVKAHSAGLGVN